MGCADGKFPVAARLVFLPGNLGLVTVACVSSPVPSAPFGSLSVDVLKISD